MKKLQNNFTTPEQSKRLLELGMPADSADCYLTRFGIDEDWEVKVLNNVKYSEIAISNQEYCLPCWSVGRLIEILAICNAFGTATIDWVQFCSEQPPLQTIYDELCAGATQALLDFSKLEK